MIQAASPSNKPWWKRIWPGVDITRRAKPLAMRKLEEWPQDASVQANVAVSRDLWAAITVAQAKQSLKEIATYGVIEDGNLVWLPDSWREGGSGGVTINAEQAMAITRAAVAAGYGATNVHIHTHPGMSVWFSATDYSDHVEHIQTILDMARPVATLYFLVFDGIFAVTRRYVVEGERVAYNDGVVLLESVQLPTSRNTIYSTIITSRKKIAGYTWPGDDDGSTYTWPGDDDRAGYQLAKSQPIYAQTPIWQPRGGTQSACVECGLPAEDNGLQCDECELWTCQECLEWLITKEWYTCPWCGGEWRKTRHISSTIAEALARHPHERIDSHVLDDISLIPTRTAEMDLDPEDAELALVRRVNNEYLDYGSISAEGIIAWAQAGLPLSELEDHISVREAARVAYVYGEKAIYAALLNATALGHLLGSADDEEEIWHMI